MLSHVRHFLYRELLSTFKQIFIITMWVLLYMQMNSVKLPSMMHSELPAELLVRVG